jgi:hypothetical protein
MEVKFVTEIVKVSKFYFLAEIEYDFLVFLYVYNKVMNALKQEITDRVG